MLRCWSDETPRPFVPDVAICFRFGSSAFGHRADLLPVCLFRRDFWRWSSEGCLSFGLHCLDPLPINRLHRRSVPPEGGSRLPRGEFTTSGRRFAQRGKIVTTFEGGVWIVRCVIVRDCACSLDWLNSVLARTEREINRHSRLPHQSYPWKKSRFHPGRVLRRRPGSGEAPFCGSANLWTAFQTSSTILQWEFFLGLGDEKKKKKNTCAHKFLFETNKTTSGSSMKP